MRDYLRTLNKNELFQLEKLLCTNEEINLAQSLASNNQATTNASAADESTGECCNSDDSTKKVTVIVPGERKGSNENFYAIKGRTAGSDNSEWISEENAGNRNEAEEPEVTTGENDDDENLVTADCATGYLVPNTNLGKIEINLNCDFSF